VAGRPGLANATRATVTAQAAIDNPAPEPKRHVEIPGAGHHDWVLLAGNPLIRETLGRVAS
jgi:hypothetical protein